MSETFSWPAIREETISRFRDVPRADTEAAVVEAFEMRPSFVLRCIDQIAAGLDSGKPIRSPWAVLRSRIHGAGSGPTSLIVVEDASDRERAIRQSEQWIRTAGIHFDREQEVEDDLFGAFGSLRQFDSEALRRDMLAMWREQRPRGEQVDRDAEAFAEEWKATQIRIAAMKEAKRQALEAGYPSTAAATVSGEQ